MEINLDLIQSFNVKIEKDDRLKLAMNAVGRVDLNELALNRELIKGVNFSFSDEVEVSPEATAQQNVGVCWIFAAMNFMRFFARKNLNLKTFEFSGPYLMFWDKFEKANYFLEKMIEFSDREYHDRELWELMKEPVADGGDWYMFVNLVKKYGMLPSSVMQHAPFSKDSGSIGKALNTKLRFDAAEIRKMRQDGCSMEKIQERRRELVEEIYRILVTCFGTPPNRFSWSYRDEDKAFHRFTDITPHAFYEKCAGQDLDAYASIWSSPLPDTPYDKTYSMVHSRKMVGGQNLLSLNISFENFKAYAIDRLKKHEPLLFSCDVLKDNLRKEGYLLKNLYNYELIFQTSFNMDKVPRLQTRDTCMTHCMLLVGVDLDDNGVPIKWKVENSWGAELGNKGYFIMDDGWFNDHVYQIIMPKAD
ncbi:aminopeptidase, partial [bacterium]|nr:aminopeptidase [bacterium]